MSEFYYHSHITTVCVSQIQLRLSVVTSSYAKGEPTCDARYCCLTHTNIRADVFLLQHSCTVTS
jgi:hypothetical protein